MAALDLGTDASRVAQDVGADLHDRDVAVAARQGHEIRLRHDRRLIDRAPAQSLQAEDQPDLLGERREAVVVKDELAHQRSLTNSASALRKAMRSPISCG